MYNYTGVVAAGESDPVLPADVLHAPIRLLSRPAFPQACVHQLADRQDVGGEGRGFG